MNSKEIGGFLDVERNYDQEFHLKAIKTNLARNSLEYLIKIKKIKKIYLPIYSCECIKAVCKKNNVEVIFYDLNQDFSLDIDKIDNHSYIYIINYFGCISNLQLKKYQKKFSNIIVDNVQDFFRKPLKKVDTIYSVRKYFGTADGSYLYTNSEKRLELDFDKSYSRMSYLFGRYEISANEFYKVYLSNENLLNSVPLLNMSLSCENILKGLNYKKIKKIRAKNFKYLNRQLKRINKLKLKKGNFMYPLYVDNACVIRKKLIENKVYVPILWPNSDEKNKFSNNIVCLPIDQRYNIEDMKIIVKIIMEVFNEKI